jgi:hypothetical protein
LSALPHRARAFGLDWAADVPLDRFDPGGDPGAPADFELARTDNLPPRRVITRKGRGEICADGFRFAWANVATFDVYHARQIRYLPGAGWRGTFPDALYSTVAALALAERGLLPLHASAIELDGRAFLFAGKGGAGKSTLTAELLAEGVRLLGDDLTVLTPPQAGHGFLVARGRPAMRLHPATAALLDSTDCERVPDDARGKLLVRPAQRAADELFPLAGIFLLGPGPCEVSLAEALRLLPPQVFRPQWLRAMPGHGQRNARLIELAGTVPVRRLPPAHGFDPAARQVRMGSLLKMLAA